MQSPIKLIKLNCLIIVTKIPLAESWTPKQNAFRYLLSGIWTPFEVFYPPYIHISSKHYFSCSMKKSKYFTRDIIPHPACTFLMQAFYDVLFALSSFTNKIIDPLSSVAITFIYMSSCMYILT